MTGRRYFQRGHASLPSTSLSSGTSGVFRWLLGGAVVVAGATALFVSARLLRGTPADTHAAPATVTKSLSQPGSGGPLIETAFAPTLRASLADETSSSSSGLQQNPLSEEGVAQVAPLLGQAELRLISIYRLISQGNHREALHKADQLVRDHPNFQLAHLIHGDLLSTQVRPVRQLGDVPDTTAIAASQQLATLREESRRRLIALTERPPVGAVPSQFLSISSQSRHAIAIDASRSRLYLFENQTPSSARNSTTPPAPSLKLVRDFYISVGLSGIEKVAEGDKRTPLGVYYITSSLNPSTLPDLYGVGALPINYPNALDVLRGKTGSGIWLHGTPREQFVRAPQASDGCVVLSNPDLEKLLETVQIRTTPVVIAQQLEWVSPASLVRERREIEGALESWGQLKSEGDTERLRAFYLVRPATSKEATPWLRMESEARTSRPGRPLQLKDVSMLRWKDSQDTMVVTFGEVAEGLSRGVTRRQYWIRDSDQWKIFHESTL